MLAHVVYEEENWRRIRCNYECLVCLL